MNIGYHIYPKPPGLELATWSVTSVHWEPSLGQRFAVLFQLSSGGFPRKTPKTHTQFKNALNLSPNMWFPPEHSLEFTVHTARFVMILMENSWWMESLVIQKDYVDNKVLWRTSGQQRMFYFKSMLHITSFSSPLRSRVDVSLERIIFRLFDGTHVAYADGWKD